MEIEVYYKHKHAQMTHNNTSEFFITSAEVSTSSTLQDVTELRISKRGFTMDQCPIVTEEADHWVIKIGKRSG